MPLHTTPTLTRRILQLVLSQLHQGEVGSGRIEGLDGVGGGFISWGIVLVFLDV